jgi:hypothetical protein
LSYTRKLFLLNNGKTTIATTPAQLINHKKQKQQTLVEGEGFEPSKAEPSDLQSDPFDRSGTPPNRTRDYANQLLACQTELIAPW